MELGLIEILKVIFLGIVEGITEWLPISSTGHMLLVDEFIHLSVSDSFKEMFFVVIQLGAILAVVLLYWEKMLLMVLIIYAYCFIIVNVRHVLALMICNIAKTDYLFCFFK